ncbi:MAG: hypothetical protein HZA50_08660 [Planctomycetes bacterium]|nr:hypothetical protein [Planctomycetota bacterium]
MSKQHDTFKGSVADELSSAGQSPRWQATTAAVLAIFVACVAAYFNSFPGQFVYDDITFIPNNPVVTLGPWSGLNSNRPIIGLAFSLNYYFSEKSPWDYHLTNMLIHFLAATVLFGIIRRTLGLPRMPAMLSDHAAILAGAIAILWAVHPLQTESVTFIMQRCESLMGLFFMLTIYCMIRAGLSESPVLWSLGAVVSFILGAGCKETIITAPIIVLLYDMIFLAPVRRLAGAGKGGLVGSAASALRKGWVFYSGLILSGVVIAAIAHRRIAQILARAGGETANKSDFSPLNYAMTQFKALWHYLALTFWPAGLCLDYLWPVAKSFGEVWPYAIGIGLLLILTLILLWRRPTWGFLGLWFFINLAPRSGFYPRPDVVVEHRMYLPLAAVIAAAVLGLYLAGVWLARRLGGGEKPLRIALIVGSACWGAAVIALIARTAVRNADYHSEVGIWRATVAVSPNNYRAHNNLGRALIQRASIGISHQDMLNDLNEAIKQFAISIEIKPQPEVYKNISVAFIGRAQPEAAASALLEGIRKFPEFKDLYFWLRNAMEKLDKTGKNAECFAEIMDFLQRLAAIQPRNAFARHALAFGWMVSGDDQKAAVEYRAAYQIAGPNVDIMRDLAWLLATSRDESVRNGKEAVELAEAACRMVENSFRTPENMARMSDLRGIFSLCMDVLGAAYAEAGMFDRAVEAAQNAISLARDTKITLMIPDYLERLKLYKQNRPYRQSVKPGKTASMPATAK